MESTYNNKQEVPTTGIPFTENEQQNLEIPLKQTKKPKRNRTGRRKIPIQYIEDKSRRHITFSKRKGGIMKKAYELSTLTGTQVLLLIASETGHVYTFATPKLQPLITKPEGKNLIQACLNAPDNKEEEEEEQNYVPQPIKSEMREQEIPNYYSLPSQMMYQRGNYQQVPPQVPPQVPRDMHQYSSQNPQPYMMRENPYTTPYHSGMQNNPQMRMSLQENQHMNLMQNQYQQKNL